VFGQFFLHKDLTHVALYPGTGDSSHIYTIIYIHIVLINSNVLPTRVSIVNTKMYYLDTV